jgi:serine phosphatase RsbU (regulator of sigma subunit)
VTEARNTAGEFYGEQRLTTLLNTNAARACDDLLKLIVTDVGHSSRVNQKATI